MPEKDFADQPTIPSVQVQEKEKMVCPTYIGPYKIESLYKTGGMSYLFLASHPDTRRPLIVKVLSPKYVKHKEMIDRFLKEAEIISLSNHPNIVKLYGQGKWDKGLYIAMEFIQGISLKQFLVEKSLSHKKSLEIILQVSYALCHLHTHGIIHRDLKPENILISETGEIKIIDFGIAQLVDKERITIYSRFMGTPVYMSPEQKEDPKTVSFTSDIYSLGIITYELILGRLSHGVIHLSLIPRDLRKILDKSLQVNPKDRYQDIVDFITDISEYMQTHDDKEEEIKEEKSDVIFDALKKTQYLLLRKDVPKLPNLDIGIAFDKHLSFSSLYLDYFAITENSFAIILAKSEEKGIESLTYTSILRGMIRTILAEKEIHPEIILNRLNQALLLDPMHQKFKLSLCIINLQTDAVLASSCGINNIWHVSEDTKMITNLSTSNHLLGIETNLSLIESESNFNLGDKLILHSIKIPDEDLTQVNDYIKDNILYSPQAQATKILEGIKSINKNTEEDLSVVICIQRKL